MGLRRRNAGQPGLCWRIRDDVQLEGVWAGPTYGWLGDMTMCSHTDAVSKRESLKGMPWFLLQGISLLF